jgi:hypothetical protein
MNKRILSPMSLVVAALWFGCLLASLPAMAQTAQTKGSILLTIFLKHDQSKTLEEINSHLDKTGFWKEFPPEGTEVVSWYVMMGIGQVVTLRVPPEKLREVNLVLEKRAWGAYRTEFYPTYDFRPVWESTYKKK